MSATVLFVMSLHCLGSSMHHNLMSLACPMDNGFKTSQLQTGQAINPKMELTRAAIFLTTLGVLTSQTYGLQIPNINQKINFFERFQNLSDLVLELEKVQMTNNITSNNISETCQLHYYQLQIDKLNGIQYALEFEDSEGKFPSGIRLGNNHWWGSYDQCVGAKNVFGNTSEPDVIFKGKYCRDIWNDTLNIGRCFPDTCSDEDIQNILRPDVNIVCPSRPDLDAGDIVAVILLSILGLLVVIGTGTDIVTTQQSESLSANTPPTQGLLTRAILSFSVISNLPKLLSTETRHGDISVLNGIRVLSLFWIMLGHTFTFGLIVVSDNMVSLREYAKYFGFRVVYDSQIAVDTFFVLSGLLVCYLTLKQLEKGKGKMNWFLFYFHRFWRLTPVYMFTVMMCATLIGNMISDGPVTDYIYAVERYCTETWWANLLYIQNFYAESLRHMCINWTWYLADDMQFYFISPVIIIALYRKPKIGMVFMCLLLVMCLLVRGIVAHEYVINPVAFAYVTNPRVADHYYLRPYYRISPYITGLALGYFLWYKKLKITISWPIAIVGWIVAAVMNMSVVYGLLGYYKDENYNMDTALVFYQTFSRWAWSLGVAWVVLACIAGKGGWINTFLSWKMWIPLARLSYTAYLIHVPIICLHSYSQHNPFHFDTYTLMYKFLAEILMTIMASTVIVSAIEFPMMGIEKIIIQLPTMLKQKNIKDGNESNPDIKPPEDIEIEGGIKSDHEATGSADNGDAIADHIYMSVNSSSVTAKRFIHGSPITNENTSEYENAGYFPAHEEYTTVKNM